MPNENKLLNDTTTALVCTPISKLSEETSAQTLRSNDITQPKQQFEPLIAQVRKHLLHTLKVSKNLHW